MNRPNTFQTSECGLRIYTEPNAQDLALVARVLLIDREPESRSHISAQLVKCGCEITLARSLHEAQAAARFKGVDLLVHRVDDPGEKWPEADAYVADQLANIPRIVITDSESLATPAEAHGSIPTPFLILNTPVYETALQIAVRRAFEFAALRSEHEKQFRQLALRGTRDIVGHSPSMGLLRERIMRIAGSEKPVLVQGESGTGKQTAARSMHDCSPRAHRPYLSVDCSLLTAACLERELFGEMGHEPFGVGIQQHGRFDLAAGGTLVLLNIDEMALMLQADVAQVLHERRFRRLGSREYRPLDTNLIATTRYDLAAQARQGLFRSDLLEEFAQSQLKVPPLRERREDIAALTEHFLRNVSLKHGMPAKRIPTQTMEILTRYLWPGNVRELENLIERACALDCGPKLDPEMIRPWLLTSTANSDGLETGMSLKEMERKLIESAFSRYSGNREKTAQALGIGLRTLSGKLREYGYPPRGGPGSNRSGNRAA